MTHAFDDFYRQAIAYAARQTAHLPSTQGLGLDLAVYLIRADEACAAGDQKACQANLHQWFMGWKQIGDAAKAA